MRHQSRESMAAFDLLQCSRAAAIVCRELRDNVAKATRRGGREPMTDQWRVRTLSLVAAAVMATAAVPASAATCSHPNDLPAIKARVLQSHLMVAALRCGERDRYNAFVTKFQTELTSRGKALKALFERSYGSKAPEHINRFVTALANTASKHSMASQEFCDDAAALFEKLQQIETPLFSEVVATQPFPGAEIGPCRQQQAEAPEDETLPAAD